MRWPEGPLHLAINLIFYIFFCFGPPHLALNPPYRFFSLLLIEKTVVPLNKGIFVYFRVFPFVLSSAFSFWPPTC